MRKMIIKIIASFILNKEKRKSFRKKYLCKEKCRVIQQLPEWPELYEQYLRLDIDYLFDIYMEKFKKSDIFTDQNDWFYLTYLCILLQKKELKRAKQILTDYVSGINKLKHIEQFLPVADLAEKMGYTNDRIHKAALVFRKLEKNKNKFKKLIHGKTVAVVGNGPSEVGKGKGPEIDAHDIVIRLNNYRTEGFEADYGSKTDIWIRGFGGNDLLDYTNKNQYVFAGITGSYYFIPLYWDFQLDILYRDLIEQKINTGYISCSLYSKLVAITDLLSPTTGFSALYTLLHSKCKKITPYGFSFQQEKSDGYASHYFNDRDENEARERSVWHSLDKESEWIIKLLKNKK